MSPHRKGLRLAASIFAMAQGGAVMAQGSATPASADQASVAGDIIVTGTRDANQTAAKSLSPITVVSATQLRQTGQGDLRDALVQLTPSLSRQVMGLDQGSLTDALSLRGLTADQTLVLVNGRRRHTTAALNFDPGPQQGTTPVDIDMIPASAVERIEVLQDGAAAQYGSDAIAGVINIILKGQNHGLSAQALNGGYYKGDGFTTNESVSQGFDLHGRGFVQVSAEVLHRNRTDRSGADTRTGLFNNPAIGSPETTRESISVNAAYQLSPGVEIYSFDSFAHRDARRWAYVRLPSSLPAVHPNGYQPVETIGENDFSASVGLRGDNLLGWHWDLSSTFGGDSDNLGLYDTANTGLYAATGSTPTSVKVGHYGNTQWTNNLDLRRAFALPWLAAPLNVALGGEYRHDTYSIDPGDEASYAYGGTQGYQGIAPINTTRAHRDVAAAYIDLSTRLLPGWQVDLAGRYEHYSDVGDTETGKVSTRYDVTRWLALRGTVSNGFRAPTLAQEHFVSIIASPTYANAQLAVDSPGARALGASPLRPEKSTNYSAGLVLNPLPRLTVTVDAYQISIRDRIVDGGVYNGQSALDALALQGVSLPAGVAPGNVAAQYFANGVNTRTKGLDITLRYQTPLGNLGLVTWDVAANVNHTKVTHVGTDQNGNPLLNAQGIAYLSSVYPASKIIFGGHWTKDRWDITAHEIRYGRTNSQLEYYSGPNAFSNTTFLPFANQPRWVTNLEIGYRVNERLHVALGANNLFDAYPSRIPAETSYIGAARYDTASQQLGQDGGFYYLRLNLNI